MKNLRLSFPVTVSSVEALDTGGYSLVISLALGQQMKLNLTKAALQIDRTVSMIKGEKYEPENKVIDLIPNVNEGDEIDLILSLPIKE